MKQIQRILKKENIIKAAPEDTLSSVLAKLSSSHDAAFVFDETNQFIGLINPYYTIVKSSAFDGNTKVEHALFHPPKIHYTDPLGKIARLMVESKVHYLPLVDDMDQFAGITSGRRILSLMQDTDITQTPIQTILDAKTSPTVSVYEEDTVGEAMNLFKEHKISKLIVIRKDMKLVGVLSYYELIPYLMAPGTRKERGRRGTGDKEKLIESQVKNYAKTRTLTLAPTDTLSAAIELILNEGVGSVVIVDGKRHPVGIITTKDILKLLVPEEKQKMVRLTAKNLSDECEKNVNDLYDFIQRHIESHDDIKEAEIVINEEKKGVLWTVHTHLIPVRGKMKVFRKEGKDLDVLVKDIKSVVSRQYK